MKPSTRGRIYCQHRNLVMSCATLLRPFESKSKLTSLRGRMPAESESRIFEHSLLSVFSFCFSGPPAPGLLAGVHRTTQGCGLLKEQRGLVEARPAKAMSRALRGRNWQIKVCGNVLR